MIKEDEKVEEKVKLSDYLSFCLDFEKDRNREEADKNIKNFLGKLIIKEYLPLSEKQVRVIGILDRINSDYDVSGVAALLEIEKIRTGLLSYCVNLEDDVPSVAGYFLVDMGYQYGLCDTIMSVCEKDVNRLFKMIDDSMNAANIYRITQTASLFNKEAYDEWLDNMEKLKETLNSENLKELLSVAGSESPEVKEMFDSLRDLTVKGIQEDIRNEAKKFEKAAALQKENNSEGKEEDDESLNEKEQNGKVN